MLEDMLPFAAVAVSTCPIQQLPETSSSGKEEPDEWIQVGMGTIDPQCGRIIEASGHSREQARARG